MQAFRWPGATSVSGGTARAQSGIAQGQRVRNTQPEGGLAGLGCSPVRMIRSALPPPIRGAADSSAFV
jgi:hypothetical protein